MIVFLARDIQAFVMYCVNGTFCSSLLIESTDSMIISLSETWLKSCYPTEFLIQGYHKINKHRPRIHRIAKDDQEVSYCI